MLPDSDGKLIKIIVGLPGECVQHSCDKCFINHKLIVNQEDRDSTNCNQVFRWLLATATA